MDKHQQLTDLKFEMQFANCSMDPNLFSHEAHIRLAWIHIHKYGVEKACDNVCVQIQKFDRVFDEGIKFNHTVTVACVRAVNHFIQKNKIEKFDHFISTYPQLETNLRGILDCHYGFDIYNNKMAKEEYLEPDLLAF